MNTSARIACLAILSGAVATSACTRSLLFDAPSIRDSQIELDDGNHDSFGSHPGNGSDAGSGVGVATGSGTGAGLGSGDSDDDHPGDTASDSKDHDGGSCDGNKGNGSGTGAGNGSDVAGNHGGSDTGGDGTPPGSCESGESRLEVEFRCHTSAASGAQAVHCVFKLASETENSALPMWFDYSAGSDAAQGAACSPMEKGSILSRLSALPDKSGEYQVTGSIQGCVRAGDSDAGKRAASLALLRGFSRASQADDLAGGQARRGSQSYSLKDVNASEEGGLYCLREGE